MQAFGPAVARSRGIRFGARAGEGKRLPIRRVDQNLQGGYSSRVSDGIYIETTSRATTSRDRREMSSNLRARN
jgi:hypothetical protein